MADPTHQKPVEAAMTPVPDALSAAIDRIVQRIAELPDRTSPDDWPEAMLVTAGELRQIADEALRADTLDVPSPPQLDEHWVNAEIERGHYSLIRITLAQRHGSVAADIIREELLQLVRAALDAVRLPVESVPAHSFVECVRDVADAAQAYLDYLNGDGSLGSDEFKMRRGRVVTLACQLRAKVAADTYLLTEDLQLAEAVAPAPLTIPPVINALLLALSEDASGVPAWELLRTCAESFNAAGGGPLADRCSLMAAALEAAAGLAVAPALAPPCPGFPDCECGKSHAPDGTRAAEPGAK